MYTITVQDDTITGLRIKLEHMLGGLPSGNESPSDKKIIETAKTTFRANDETEKAKGNVTNLKQEVAQDVKSKGKAKPALKEEAPTDDDIPDYAKVVRPATFKFLAANSKPELDTIFAAFSVESATQLKPAQYKNYMTALANYSAEAVA